MEGKEKKYSDSDDIQLILEYISKIRFGSVTVVIQDGKIVQVEKNEKIRFTN